MNSGGASAFAIRPDGREETRAGATATQVTRMMRRLQMLDFSLQELVLYLDMYPECRRALDRYHTLREERDGIKASLEAAGYPVSACGNGGREAWVWADGPWPWEYDFIGNAWD